MSQRRSRLSPLAPTMVLVLGAGLALVQAQGTDENLVEYRQRLMTAHGASMGSIGDMLKYQLDYGTDQIHVHASNINNYAKLIPEVFEKEITTGKTDAKAEIWDNWDDFVSKAKTLETEASKLATAASSASELRALMPNVRATGDACRSCHDSYRKPKEESYKTAQ